MLYNKYAVEWIETLNILDALVISEREDKQSATTTTTTRKNSFSFCATDAAVFLSLLCLLCFPLSVVVWNVKQTELSLLRDKLHSQSPAASKVEKQIFLREQLSTFIREAHAELQGNSSIIINFLIRN